MKPLFLQLLLSVATAVGLCMGCDEPADDMTQVVLDQQAKQAAAEKALPKIPTTQELMGGPRSVVPLGPLPLTLKVPASWRVEVAGGASLLRGFSPQGEITVQLTSRPSIKQAQLDSEIRGAKKEQAEKPQSILKVDLRPLGNVQIYERQAVGDPAPYTVYETVNGQMKEKTTTEQLFKWTITILAPQGDAFQRYELNFVGLTKSQYDKDREFLQGILDTLSYAGGDGAATAPTAPGSPAATASP
jgi:hypothetical protein